MTDEPDDPLDWSMTVGEFSVCEFYSDGTHSYVERWISAEDAVKLAKWCIEEAEAEPGQHPVIRIIITDGGDYTTFQWERGKGITYPV